MTTGMIVFIAGGMLLFISLVLTVFYVALGRKGKKKLQEYLRENY